MKKYFQLLLVLVLTGITSQVAAETISYTYISVEYSQFSSQTEGFSEVLEGSGTSIELSLAVRPHVAIVASYSTGSADATTSGTTIDADIKSTSFGILAHVPVNDTTDFLLSISFINGHSKINKNGTFFANVDADGGVTAIGIRSMASDKFELNGFINRKSIEDESRLGMSLGAAYYFAESLSVDFGYEYYSDTDSLSVGVTKYF